MGTRSLTRVFKTYKDEKKNKQVKVQLVNMYRQYDGYPSGHGDELAEFLNGGKVVNGIGVDEKQTVFNGAGCLAAQMIAHFKDGAGGFYIYPTTAKDCGQEYEYEIVVDFDTKEITLKCIEVGYIDSKGNYKNGKKVLFEGSPSEYEVWLEKYETA
jgi:hypothetical protein